MHLEFSVRLVMESGANLKEKFQRGQDQVVSGVSHVAFGLVRQRWVTERKGKAVFLSSCFDPCWNNAS